MQLVDSTADQVKGCITLSMVKRVRRDARNDIAGAIRHIPKPIAATNGYIDPITMTPYLQACQRAVAEMLCARADEFSSLRWLWYLRRLPRALFEDGYLVTTFLYDSALAEVLSAHSTNSTHDLLVLDGVVTYPITEGTVERVVRFCYGVKYLASIHARLRRAGKGAQFFFDGDVLPQTHLTPDHIEAIQLYDKRNAGSGIPLSRLGTVGSSEMTTTKKGSPGILVLGFTDNPRYGQVPFGRAHAPTRHVTSYVNFVPRFVSIEGLQQLAHDPRLAGLSWAPVEIGALLLLLSLIYPFVEGSDHFIHNLCRSGYHIVTIDRLRDIFDTYAGAWVGEVAKIMPDLTFPTSADDLVATLSRFKGTWWPLRQGNPIRHAPHADAICLDFYAASVYLDTMLEYPKVTGDVANARADHFEGAVQEMIKDSPWQPPEDIARLRRRTLRIGGRDRTDLDAVGTRQNTLLIVSCKSTIRSGLYDTGDYTAVRNAASLVTNEVAYMAGIKQTLLATPVGDNYDLSRYHDILAIVCTPNVVYVPTGDATAEPTPGLYAACSCDELRTWLAR